MVFPSTDPVEHLSISLPVAVDSARVNDRQRLVINRLLDPLRR